LSDPEPTGKSQQALFLAAFIGLTVLVGLDVMADVGEGSAIEHLLTEGAIMAFGLVGVVLVGRRFIRTLAEAREAQQAAAMLEKQLEARTREAARWRREARDLMAGLGASIDEQFGRWNLSPAEKEVALLLLKGLSHKDIAAARGVTEATARQQARAVYKKASLTGRHDLAAFFLEDLMLPAADR
jgi:DNA-binding NarL/FixJ family response regulator